VIVRKTIPAKTSELNVEAIYFEHPPDREPEELVITVYGGGSETTRKVIAQTEVLAHRRIVGSRLQWLGPTGLKLDRYEMKMGGYISAIAVSMPRIMSPWWPKKEVDLECDLPKYIRRGDTLMVVFPKELLEFK